MHVVLFYSIRLLDILLKLNWIHFFRWLFCLDSRDSFSYSPSITHTHTDTRTAFINGMFLMFVGWNRANINNDNETVIWLRNLCKNNNRFGF